MLTTLEVVNECLATLGESPLNTLSEPHEYKASALRVLSKVSDRVQVEDGGWWYNKEAVKYSPNSITGQVQFPGDTLRWQSGTRSRDNYQGTEAKPYLIRRGNRMYDTINGTYIITEDVSGEIVRSIPFDELPTVIAEYISATTVLKFQSDFDADNSRRAELKEAVGFARMQARAEHIRQSRNNFINNNANLSRIKAASRGVRF